MFHDGRELGAPAWRPPTAYVHGGASVVVVPARVAAWLERHAGLRQLRTHHRGVDGEVDSVLVALGLAALAWRTSAPGIDPRNTAELEPPCQRMTTQQVGALLGITARAVRQAIARGRLPAERVGDRWIVSREDVEHYRAATAV